MQKAFLVVAGISGAIAVLLGAMGAHALSGKLSPDHLQSYETAVRYQFYHTLALMALAYFPVKPLSGFPVYSGYCFIIGILLFSGSIYLLSTRELSGMNWTWLGPVTPLGGLFFIAGWILLVWGAIKLK